MQLCIAQYGLLIAQSCSAGVLHEKLRSAYGVNMGPLRSYLLLFTSVSSKHRRCFSCGLTRTHKTAESSAVNHSYLMQYEDMQQGCLHTVQQHAKGSMLIFFSTPLDDLVSLFSSDKGIPQKPFFKKQSAVFISSHIPRVISFCSLASFPPSLLCGARQKKY